MEGLDSQSLRFESPMILLDFEIFKGIGHIPRSNERIAHPHVVLDEVQDRQNVMILFISHRWFQEKNPDTQNHVKYKVLVKSIQQIQNSISDGAGRQVFLWIDFFSIEQDDEAEKIKGINSLPAYIYNSDGLLSPFSLIVSKNSRDDLGKLNPFIDYNYWFQEYFMKPCFQIHPNEYFGRAWCRLELFLGSNIELSPDGFKYFERLNQHHFSGRPHFIHEEEDGKNVFLPTCLSSLWWQQLCPSEGTVSCQADCPRIHKLIQMFDFKERLGFTGELSHGKRKGYGRYTFAFGEKVHAIGGEVRVYIGNWKDDQEHGQGVCLYADGSLYEGEWRHGNKHGQGTLRTASGSIIFQGNWKNNFRCYQGVLSDSSGNKWYEGNYLETKPHGEGCSYYLNRRQCYNGHWVEGQRCGQGSQYSEQGDKLYIGEWKGDKLNGQGVLYQTGGASIYEGEFLEDKMNSQDVSFSVKGKKQYEGEWKDDTYHGKGILYDSLGSIIYDGQFSFGKYHGKGICYDPSMGFIIYNGEFQNDLKHGYGVFYFSNGKHQYKGGLVQGSYDGKGTLFQADGSCLYDGEFRNGKKNGTGVLFFPNGSKHYEGNWNQDVYSGKGILYSLDGGIEFDGAWRFGERWDGIGIQYFRNGSKEYEGTWTQGKMLGVGTHFNESGQVHYQILTNGSCTYYFDDGRICQGKFCFEKLEVTSGTVYYASGHVLQGSMHRWPPQFIKGFANFSKVYARNCKLACIFCRWKGFDDTLTKCCGNSICTVCPNLCRIAHGLYFTIQVPNSEQESMCFAHLCGCSCCGRSCGDGLKKKILPGIELKMQVFHPTYLISWCFGEYCAFGVLKLRCCLVTSTNLDYQNFEPLLCGCCGACFPISLCVACSNCNPESNNMSCKYPFCCACFLCCLPVCFFSNSHCHKRNMDHQPGLQIKVQLHPPKETIDR